MKSRPASSAMSASLRQSGQLADQRSGTVVADRPDEQLAPNRPILSALPLYMAILFFKEAPGASIAFLPFFPLLLRASLSSHGARCRILTKSRPRAWQ